MPEIGGGKLAGEFSQMIADMRERMGQAKKVLADATSELYGEVRASEEVAKQIRSEAAMIRESFAQVLGNRPPADDSEEKKS